MVCLQVNGVKLVFTCSVLVITWQWTVINWGKDLLPSMPPYAQSPTRTSYIWIKNSESPPQNLMQFDCKRTQTLCSLAFIYKYMTRLQPIGSQSSSLMQRDCRVLHSSAACWQSVHLWMRHLFTNLCKFVCEWLHSLLPPTRQPVKSPCEQNYSLKKPAISHPTRKN